MPKFGMGLAVLDKFDLALLDELQRDDGRTADDLAERIALSPSAIARRVRGLRAEGWIARTIALLSPRLTEPRLRALVFIQLKAHADLASKARLQDALVGDERVQLCLEIAGTFDLVVLTDARDMAGFNALTAELLEGSGAIQRYETSFVKRAAKFAPFARLSG